MRHKFASDEERFDIEMILANYTVMFNSRKNSVNVYAELQTINPEFPHVDDEDFWNKLNLTFIKYCDMDLQTLKEILCNGEEGEPFRRTRIFELINGKK
ncbi:hypothetical protein [Clostridium saccharobutylicum]|uniref:Uncharacterized protein n=1 Tax=Clostridium saccharobutylicum TaxID=169679 RepID=A0A1S8N663_CLOSA|nr:hypothetical protein [Clostridium saccharobutylicum]OOM11954.1 hypothetical protein CLOSAC_23830 [Clostridium saccharobutylicum]